MNDTAAEHRSRALELGLRQTSTGSCPRRLAGLPHRPGSCWCESRLNDHGRRYRRTQDDRPVILWEPYSADGEALADVLAAASVDGLHVTLSGASPWYPGNTLSIAFESTS